MKNEGDENKQLLKQISQLRKRIAELETSEKRLKHAEKALKESEERYRAVAETTIAGIGIADSEERLTFVNPAFARMLGYSQDELFGMNLSQLANQNEFTRYQDLTVQRKKGEVNTYETTLTHKDGREVYFLVSASPLMGDNNVFIGTLAVIVDITDRRQAEEEKAHLEEQLRQIQKMEAIGQLAGGIAHDFNNMLGAISGYADMIKRKFAQDNPILEKYVTQIFNSAQRAADLTIKLLTFAHKGKFEKTIVNIHKTIQDAIYLLEHTIDKDITIMQQLNAKPSSVTGDSTQLENAILNLAVNARDAMLKGGTLTFTTEIIDLDEKYIKNHPYEIKPGTYLMLSVTDTGTGMDEKTKQRIFEPFFTTKGVGKGTGLGLSTVYGIVKNHGGFIEVYSESGKGSAFKIYLPATKEAVNRNLTGATTQKGSGSILIIDDEALISDMASEILTDLGYTVTTCSNGQEGVEHYRKHHNKIDLVILDIVMPKMGGYDCFMELKKINPDVRVIISSGYTINGGAKKIMDEGALGFVQKPFKISKLSVEIARVLRRSIKE